MIKISNLSVCYENSVLENINAEFPENGIYSINAPSGRGKTTLLNAIAGLIKYSGTIETQGKISYLFQEDRLLNWYDAEKNIKLTAKNEELAEYYIKTFGIDEFRHKLPSEMSGGMKRRCAIARCFAFSGDIYLLDEPFRGLDSANTDIVISEIKKLNGLVLTITHNREDIVKLGATETDLF